MFKQEGQLAYEAYSKIVPPTAGVPEWEKLPQAIRSAWESAADAVWSSYTDQLLSSPAIMYLVTGEDVWCDAIVIGDDQCDPVELVNEEFGFDGNTGNTQMGVSATIPLPLRLMKRFKMGVYALNLNDLPEIRYFKEK